MLVETINDNTGVVLHCIPKSQDQLRPIHSECCHANPPLEQSFGKKFAASNAFRAAATVSDRSFEGTFSESANSAAEHTSLELTFATNPLETQRSTESRVRSRRLTD